MPADEELQLARRFLEVVPGVMHSLGSMLRDMEVGSGPISIQQFRTMAVLRRGSRSLGELATLHEVTPPAVSRLISTLVERGWVQRESDPDDRRLVVLTLTTEGEAVWNTLAQRSATHLASLLSELTAEERQALDSALVGLGRVVQPGK